MVLKKMFFSFFKKLIRNRRNNISSFIKKPIQFSWIYKIILLFDQDNTNLCHMQDKLLTLLSMVAFEHGPKILTTKAIEFF